MTIEGQIEANKEGVKEQKQKKKDIKSKKILILNDNTLVLIFGINKLDELETERVGFPENCSQQQPTLKNSCLIH